jgi:hypothetical protein
MNNINRTEWSDANFDAWRWHDNTIHGIRISNPSEGYAFDLILDIDFILEWISTPEKHYKFSVAPAILTFNAVDKFNCDIELNYKESMTIDRIERIEITTENQRKTGIRNFRWEIHLHSQSGRDNKMSFNASGFKQLLTCEPKITTRQDLE